MAKMKTNHKHYSAGAVIWIIIKYFSLVFFSFVALLPIVSCVITAAGCILCTGADRQLCDNGI